MPRKKLTAEQRIAAVEEYLNGKGSYRGIAKKYGIDKTTVQYMVGRAKTEGIYSLMNSHKYNKYSDETKRAAIKDYVSGKGSIGEICKKYKISNRSIVKKWIKRYNSGNDIKERRGSERGITVNKGRKTTQEERTEIVAFCIANGRDYELAMEKYSVSYQQIYSWVRKYEAHGIEGLIDRRGKAKPENELTESEKLKMENKILQAKLRDMEMENKLLKKLKELKEGGR